MKKYNKTKNKNTRKSKNNKNTRKAGVINMRTNFLDILIYKLKKCLKLDKVSEIDMEFDSIQKAVDRIKVSYSDLYEELKKIIEDKENNINLTNDVKEKKKEIKRAIIEIKILKNELMNHNNLSNNFHKKTFSKTSRKYTPKKSNLLHMR